MRRGFLLASLFTLTITTTWVYGEACVFCTGATCTTCGTRVLPGGCDEVCGATLQPSGTNCADQCGCHLSETQCVNMNCVCCDDIGGVASPNLCSIEIAMDAPSMDIEACMPNEDGSWTGEIEVK